MIFRVEVDDSSFQEWADRTIERVRMMKDTLLEVSRLIENTTNPLVPYRTGLLESSYLEAPVSDYPLIEVEIGYSVASVGGGWDYAHIQHEKNFNHPRRGTMRYLYKGIQYTRSEAKVMIEKDYLTALGV